jgi:hypothetical protein
MHATARRRTTLGVAVATVLLSAYAAGQVPALGAQKPSKFAPRLRVEASRYDAVRPSQLTIDVTQTATEPRIARMSFIVPSGYTITTVQRGRRFARATVGITQPGERAQLPQLLLTGELVAIEVHGNSCVAQPDHVYQGVVASDPGGTTKARMTLTVFEQKVGTAHRYTVCLPAQSPAPGSIRRVQIEVITGILPPGPGRPVWRGLFTPVKPSAEAARKATTEAQSVVPLPSFLTLSSTTKLSVQPGATVAMSGVLSLNGPSGRRQVRLSYVSGRSNAQYAGMGKTAPSGRYTTKIKVPAQDGIYYYTARALSKNVPCQSPSSEAPAGCTSSTLSGISSAPLKIVVKS